MEQETASWGCGRGSPGAHHPTRHTDTQHITQTHSTSHTRHTQHVTQTHNTSHTCHTYNTSHTYNITQTRSTSHTAHHTRDTSQTQHLTQTHIRCNTSHTQRHTHNTSHTCHTYNITQTRSMSHTQHVKHTTHHTQHIRHTCHTYNTSHRHAACHTHSTSHTQHITHMRHHRDTTRHTDTCGPCPALGCTSEHKCSPNLTRLLSPQAPAEHRSHRPHASRQTRTHRQTSSAPHRLLRPGSDTRVIPQPDTPLFTPAQSGHRPGCQQPRSLWAQVCSVVSATLSRQGPGVEPVALQPCRGPACLSGGLKISGVGTWPARLPAWSRVLRLSSGRLARGCTPPPPGQSSSPCPSGCVPTRTEL